MPPDYNPIEMHRRFRLLVIILRYPIRLFLWGLILILFYPDLAGSSGTVSTGVIFGSFALFYVCPCITHYLEYRRIPVSFHKDRIELRESLTIRENLVIPYRNIPQIKCTSSIIQKLYGLKTMCIKVRSGQDHIKTKDYWFKISDLSRDEIKSNNLADFIGKTDGA